MKPESRFWAKLKKLLPPGHVIRVENPVLPGTPDVNFCFSGVEGWMELKRVEDFPKRPETPVFTNCLKPEQKLWHLSRYNSGGRSYIVGYVEIPKITFVIPGCHSMAFNELTRSELEKLTLKLPQIWEKSPQYSELSSEFTNTR